VLRASKQCIVEWFRRAHDFNPRDLKMNLWIWNTPVLKVGLFLEYIYYSLTCVLAIALASRALNVALEDHNEDSVPAHQATESLELLQTGCAQKPSCDDSLDDGMQEAVACASGAAPRSEVSTNTPVNTSWEQKPSLSYLEPQKVAPSNQARPLVSHNRNSNERSHTQSEFLAG
jgi:hypothetical protein